MGHSCWLQKRDDIFFSLKKGLVVLSPSRPLTQSFKNALVRYKIESMVPMRERSTAKNCLWKEKGRLYACISVKQPVWADCKQEGKESSICSKMQTGK